MRCEISRTPIGTADAEPQIEVIEGVRPTFDFVSNARDPEELAHIKDGEGNTLASLALNNWLNHELQIETDGTVQIKGRSVTVDERRTITSYGDYRETWSFTPV